jgi:hypothetical protein
VVTNANLKREIRARMAATGENYTRARRVILAEREAARLVRDPEQPEPEGEDASGPAGGRERG